MVTAGKEEAAAVEDEEGHLMWAASGWDFMLEAGEVLFVPAGCAHSVRNVTDTVAISANYIDSSSEIFLILVSDFKVFYRWPFQATT